MRCGDQAAISRFLGALAGSLEIADFFSSQTRPKARAFKAASGFLCRKGRCFLEPTAG
jgi:hypothetical protein